jgi:hypothetical protein
VGTSWLVMGKFTSLYVNDVRSSQETHVGTSWLVMGKLYFFICK